MNVYLFYHHRLFDEVLIGIIDNPLAVTQYLDMILRAQQKPCEIVVKGYKVNTFGATVRVAWMGRRNSDGSTSIEKLRDDD